MKLQVPSNMFHHLCVQEAQCDSECFTKQVVVSKALVEPFDGPEVVFSLILAQLQFWIRCVQILPTTDINDIMFFQRKTSLGNPRDSSQN